MRKHFTVPLRLVSSAQAWSLRLLRESLGLDKHAGNLTSRIQCLAVPWHASRIHWLTSPMRTHHASTTSQARLASAEFAKR